MHRLVASIRSTCSSWSKIRQLDKQQRRPRLEAATGSSIQSLSGPPSPSPSPWFETCVVSLRPTGKRPTTAIDLPCPVPWFTVLTSRRDNHWTRSESSPVNSTTKQNPQLRRVPYSTSQRACPSSPTAGWTNAPRDATRSAFLIETLRNPGSPPSRNSGLSSSLICEISSQSVQDPRPMSSVSSSAPTDIPCDSVLSSFSRWTLRTAGRPIPTASSGRVSGDPASEDPDCNSSSYKAPPSPCSCCSSIQKPSLTVATHDDYDDLSSDAETLSPSPSSSFAFSSFGGVSRSASDNDVASLALSSSSDVDVETDAGCLNEMLEQSPIDIREMESQLLTLSECDITVSLGKTEAELVHQGPNFFIRWKSAEQSTLTIRGKTFHAVQFHFHTPSEHTFDGQHEAMEFHMVHQAADGNLAVIAVFFREGAENAFLAQFWDTLSGLDPDVPVSIPVGKIDPQKLDMLSGRFFRYRGSLTTPPYTEGVEWIIVQDVAEASSGQLDTFRNFLSGPNARPVQPLNKRRVSLVL